LIAEKLKEHLKICNGKAIDILIILLIGLLVLIWFNGNFIISTEDFVFTTGPVHNFLRSFYMWDLSDGLGFRNSQILTAPIYSGIVAFLNIVGGSLSSSEEFLFYINYVLAGLAMYYLVTFTLKGDKGRIAGVVSSFAYMINGFLLIYVLSIPFTKFFYALFPLIIALFVKGVNEKKGLRYAFLVGLVWLLISAAYSNPVNAITLWLVLLSYFLFEVLTNLRDKTKIWYATRFTVYLGLIWGALNSFWLIPELSSINYLYSGQSIAAIGQTDLSAFRLNSASILDIFRLQGFWAFNRSFQGDAYYPYAPIYSTTLFIFLSFLIPILAFLPILVKPRNKYILFFTILAVFGLFMIKGSYSPFGQINDWIFSNIPFSRAIREPFKVFGPLLALSYAFLIGTAVSIIYSFIRKEVKK